MKKIIRALYIVEKGLRELAEISIRSLVAHAAPEKNYEIYVAAAEKISVEVPGQVRLVNIDMADTELVLSKIMKRLNGIEKVVLVSPYTILNCDIEEIYDSVGSELAGAVRHPLTCMGEIKRYTEKRLGIPYSEFASSQLMVLNLKALGEMNFEGRIRALENMPLADFDEDVLNILCHGRIKLLPSDYLAFPGQEVESPRAVSYKYCGKPWEHKNAEYSELFRAYASKGFKANGYRGIRSIVSAYRESAAAGEYSFSFMTA